MTIILSWSLDLKHAGPLQQQVLGSVSLGLESSLPEREGLNWKHGDTA